MKKKLPLFIFIDALGWEVLQRHPDFLKSDAPERKSLRTIFGYSSACDPSIISGLLPGQHKMWSSFFYAPDSCPYRWVRYLRFLPSIISGYHRVRHKLSQLIQWVHGFTGYFQIYNVPFQHLAKFDYAEKYSIWGRDGLLRGKTVFSELTEKEIPFYCDSTTYDDATKIAALKDAVEEESIDFAYLLLGKLDATMHSVGTDHPQVDDLMQWYHDKLCKLIATAREHYEEVPVYVFADHGMHDVKGGHDLQKDIEGLGLKFGQDYACMYDSTMARFWCFNDMAKQRIHELLNSMGALGRIVPDAELDDLGVYYPDHMYGDTVFLMHSGIVIAPSFMGQKAIPGMHGFHPDDPESSASILSNRPLPDELVSIEQIFWLILHEMGLEAPDNGMDPDMAWRRPLSKQEISPSTNTSTKKVSTGA